MPSDKRLVGVRVKVARAWKHLNAIDATIGKWFEDPLSFPGLGAYFDLTQEWQELTWQRVKPMPPSWGAILGDFAHNARSALDHLIWELAENPGSHTQFPVLETEGKWRDDIAERDVAQRGLPPTAGLSDEALSFVYEFQPFHKTERGWDGTKLFQLHRISNEDKHRTLLASYPYAMSKPQDLRIVPRGYFAIERIQYGPAAGRLIENGAQLARAKLRVSTIPPPDVEMRVQFAQHANVTFSAGDTRLADATDLRAIFRAVREVVEQARGTLL